MLVLVIAPFFTSFLVRTLSWKLILADDGVVVNTLQFVHILGPNGHLLYTPFAVIMGLTYNFLPFMVLPLFASIDKIDYRLIEAANDLYANPVVGFFKVTWPLSLPGVISGTLLTFIPAVGDYINDQLLGQHPDPDDRQHDPGPLHRGQRLSRRGCAVGDPDVDDRRAGPRLREVARERRTCCDAVVDAVTWCCSSGSWSWSTRSSRSPSSS